MRDSWFRLTLLLSGSFVVGCSALIDVGGKQCNSDNECVKAELGTSCVAHICVDKSSQHADAGMDMRLPADGMCTKDAQCTNKNEPRCMNGSCVPEELAERFLCAADPETTASGTVKYSVHVLEYVTRMPPKDLMVKACRGNDVGCSDPVAMFSDDQGTGDVSLDLPVGFMGFFDVQTSDTLGALSYVTKPVVEDTNDRDLQVVSPDTLQVLSTVAGVGFEASKGLYFL
jgi:hypothetical protein